MTRYIAAFLGSLLILGVIAFTVIMTKCRVWVPQDKCLVMTRKTGENLPPGQIIAEKGQKGIQREALGPGRYFYNPFVWEPKVERLVVVPAGDPTEWKEVYSEADADYNVPQIVGKWPKVGVVTSLAGKPAPAGQKVVDKGYQGIWREVLTPGTYRLNPSAYKVELHDAAVIPLGCCGVVTSQLGDSPGTETVIETAIGPDGQTIQGEQRQVQKLADEGQRGVLKNILQPGIYYLNPYVYKVTILQIGYNEISQMKKEQAQDTIRFPSKDGFTIEIEVSVVWGRHPEHASEMIARFGDIDRIQQIVLSQIRSICRIVGSEYESTDFIRGEKREQYQRAVTETLQRVAAERDIEILIALIQNFEVQGGTEAGTEADLKTTIQRGYIAVEEEQTRQKQRETAMVKADLETAKVQIEVAREQIVAETRKKVAEIMAEGEKKAQEIDAQRDLDVARIEKQIAQLDAEKTRVLGKAEADVEKLKNQADADGKRMLIDAFGSGRAYNLYTFADTFEPESIRLIFAGEGTFWTDLSRLQDAAALELLKQSGGEKK